MLSSWARSSRTRLSQSSWSLGWGEGSESWLRLPQGETGTSSKGGGGTRGCSCPPAPHVLEQLAAEALHVAGVPKLVLPMVGAEPALDAAGEAQGRGGAGGRGPPRPCRALPLQPHGQTLPPPLPLFLQSFLDALLQVAVHLLHHVIDFYAGESSPSLTAGKAWRGGESPARGTAPAMAPGWVVRPRTLQGWGQHSPIPLGSSRHPAPCRSHAPRALLQLQALEAQHIQDFSPRLFHEAPWGGRGEGPR